MREVFGFGLCLVESGKLCNNFQFHDMLNESKRYRATANGLGEVLAATLRLLTISELLGHCEFYAQRPQLVSMAQVSGYSVPALINILLSRPKSFMVKLVVFHALLRLLRRKQLSCTFTPASFTL